MKRVLFFSALEVAPWGGSEQLWSDLAVCLLQRGHKVMTNTLDWGNIPEKLTKIQDLGGEVTLRPNIHITGDAFHSVNNRLKSYKWKTDILTFNPDIIYISAGGTFDEAIRMHGDYFASLKKPIFIMSQFMNEHEYMADDQRAFFSDYFNKAKHVFFVSERNQQNAERTIACRLRNAIVVKNPIKLKETTSSYPAGDLYNIGVVARLETEIKGYDVLLQVFANDIWKKRSVKVNVYGSGIHEAYIRELVDYYALNDIIVFKGFERDVVKIWNENNILFLSSRGEGTPLSLLEANYCKRAAVVTDVGGNADIIKDGINGFVADAPVEKCVSDAMERAWEKRDEWETMGMKAWEMITELYKNDPVEELADIVIAD